MTVTKDDIIAETAKLEAEAVAACGENWPKLTTKDLADGLRRYYKDRRLAEVDPINHPAHYTSLPARCACGAQIECIQITEHMGFNLGNAIKYVWRSGIKSQDAVTDLKKAVWYIEREIARINKETQCPKN